MARAIAFLRAINVGGRTVKMDYLRDLFAGMGFANVETFIASGNVIFEAAETDTATLAQTIEAGLQDALGYQVDTFVRTPAELAAIAAAWPFRTTDKDSPHTLYVAFLAAPPDATARDRLLALANAANTLQVAGREIYWLRRNEVEAGLLRNDPTAKVELSGGALEKALGQPATVRNARTVARLAGKYPA